jgi:hypothetical protein
MPYLGKSPQHGNYSKIDDISSGFDGSDATHAIASNSIAITPVRPEALIVSMNGVLQEPVTDYTVSGTNITFTTAPASGDSFFGVVMGEQLAIGTPSDATVTSAKLSGDLTLPGKLTAAGDTAASDNASIGYTSAEGLILTGQGSTNDITIKRDDDTAVLEVATGQSNIEVTGGNIFFGTADKGVYLGVTSATAANLLDDYEEGLYNPAITCASSGTYGLASGDDTLAYTKIGRVVHIQGTINPDSESSPSGQLRVSIPFTPEALDESADNFYSGGITMYNHGDGGLECPLVYVSGGVAYVALYNMTDAGSAENIDQDRVDTNFGISFDFSYTAA